MMKSSILYISWLLLIISCSSGEYVTKSDASRYECIKNSGAFKGHGAFSILKSKVGFYKASLKARKFSKKQFPDLKYSNTKRDAYRHVLWSALLARHFGSSSIENRVAYAIVVGEANEKCGENSEAITKMDTHNNSIGISIFKENVVQGEKPSLKEIRQFIIQLLENAQYIPIDSVTIKKIMSVDETQMVFLEN